MAGRIHIILATVHIAEDGTKTVEPVFVDEDGNNGHELLIRPDGTMEIAEESIEGYW